ncbi:O-methyltransferase [Colletotrichum abscissum]|uniref:O-methyltransferase n=3 Tax=Colletotrichum acutatum species complex TaxID=2707335 RepID=A0A9P9X3F5_9PEZI|nr:O-methyltransferase [Colletotrichum abscissum]
MLAMTALNRLAPIIGVYDFSWIAEASEKEGGGRVTLVDVGGGSSHEIQSICENTGLPLARCVFQDKETVISKVENRGLCRD